MKFFRTITALAISVISLNTFTVFAEYTPTDCPPPETEVMVIDKNQDVTVYKPNTESKIMRKAQAVYDIDENGHTKQYKSSNIKDNQFVFTIIGNTTLHIDGICSDNTKLWVWPMIKLDGKRVSGQLLVKKGDDNTVSIDMPLPTTDGIYEVSISGAPQEYTSYISILRNIKLIVENGDAYFQIPYEVYKNNLEFWEKNYRVPSYYLEQEFVASWVYTNDVIKVWAEDITKGCTTDYDKIKAVHDWVSDNIFYDYEYYENRKTITNLSAEDVYNNKMSVCQGYANLSASLLRSIGIPCKVAEGCSGDKCSDFTLSANHAWNEAWCSEQQRWIVFDATWDSNNKYDENDNNIMSYGGFGYTYFDPVDYYFAQNHRIINYARRNLTYLGDINGDSKLDKSDVSNHMKIVAGILLLEEQDKSNWQKISDVNGDKVSDFLDVIASLKKIDFNKLV